MIRFFAATALAVLGVLTYRNARRLSAGGVTGDSRLSTAAPRSLQTWEGEGGGVPASARRTVAQVPPTDESGASLGNERS